MKSIDVKVIKPVPPYLEGQIVAVKVDASKIPLEKFWRDRFRDAETDGCIEIVTPKKPKPKTDKEQS